MIVTKVVGRVVEVGAETVSSTYPRIPNLAATNTIANANGISTATATVHATTIVVHFAVIITLPTTVTTNTNLLASYTRAIEF